LKEGPDDKAWQAYIKLEAVPSWMAIGKAQAVFNVFARMEIWLKEYDRARVIYKVSS
jgi:hypothetical protein